MGCKFQGKTTFNNYTSKVKNIKAVGVILNGSIDPCTPSLFKLDKNMIFTYNNSHTYYNNSSVTASVNKPFNIGPPTTINSIPTLTYANFEIPDGSTFRSSVYENYYNPGSVLSTSPPEIYIGEKVAF
ncbi:MAG: hypothetical protein HWD58_07760 [Bacteroidota bacterium]|nr:MAG: hypothetical protein HWD58_07760 [Bacteroidota bacterium]